MKGAIKRCILLEYICIFYFKFMTLACKRAFLSCNIAVYTRIKWLNTPLTAGLCSITSYVTTESSSVMFRCVCVCVPDGNGWWKDTLGVRWNLMPQGQRDRDTLESAPRDSARAARSVRAHLWISNAWLTHFQTIPSNKAKWAHSSKTMQLLKRDCEEPS